MSGRIPKHFIDDLITRTDIVEVINARVPLKKAGREYKACCPFHEEKTPSFTVSPDKQFYHCFGCGAHGTAIGFLMDFEHLDFVESVESLAGSLGIEVPREASPTPQKREPDLYETTERAANFYREQLKGNDDAISYLKNRGLTGKIAAEFSIGFALESWDALSEKLGKTPEDSKRLLATGLASRRSDGSLYDRFRNRIIFPIRDARGRVIGFGGRVIGDDEPKYLNSPETPLFHKGRELYGLFEARKNLRDIERLIVVEGYMDVVGLANKGIRNVVATLGTATTTEHIRRLFRVTEEIVFCFDGDRAGRAAAWRALETALPEMREGRDVRFLFVPEGQDPDSLVREQGAAAFEARLPGAMPLSDFLLNHLEEEIDLSSLEGRARLAERAKPLLRKIPTGVYQQLLTERLAKK
ncbi:MAG: DNA primase, partial [Gammaproteobacteria bacterium]